MRLKSFHGSSLTEAMRMVRDALGDEAIIVATRDDDAGGVRVTAAIDDQPSVAPQPVTCFTTSPATNRAIPADEDDGSAALETIALALTRHMVPAHLAEKLMATATQVAIDDPVVALAAALDVHLTFQPINDSDTSKPVILIGPPGVGKTLTIAKLATKATMAKRPVAVFSTDFERAGGLEQLAAFTRLLNVDLVEIEDPHALGDALAMHKDKLAFIDTAGGNPFDAKELATIKTLVNTAGGEATLVMPAGLDAAEAAELAAAFQSAGAKRLMPTRLDLSKRLGGLLRLSHDLRLPLANFSATSRVTEAPAPCNPVAIARLILGIKADNKQAAASPTQERTQQGGRG